MSRVVSHETTLFFMERPEGFQTFGTFCAIIVLERNDSFANFIDLNQDGILEVVIDIQRWEVDGAAVFQVKGQDIIRVF